LPDLPRRAAQIGGSSGIALHATATLAFQLRQLPDHRFKFTCEDLQAFPDAGYRYHLLGPSVGPLVPASP
jgi:hypothetical protein